MGHEPRDLNAGFGYKKRLSNQPFLLVGDFIGAYFQDFSEKREQSTISKTRLKMRQSIWAFPSEQCLTREPV
jgi:hypothetical protein